MADKDCCLNCEFRRVGCHSKCESYRRYKEILENIRNNKLKEKEFSSFVRKRRSLK